MFQVGESFHNLYVYFITTYTSVSFNFICELYLSRAEEKNVIKKKNNNGEQSNAFHKKLSRKITEQIKTSILKCAFSSEIPMLPVKNQYKLKLENSEIR